MFAAALILLIGAGVAFALNAADRPGLAKLVGFSVFAVFAVFAILIGIGVFFGD